MYNQGEILLVPVPFTDLSSQKKRPVLVISNNEYNNATNDIIVCAITSNIIPKNYNIYIDNADLEIGNLKVKSAIRADKIYTLSQSIVIKTFGSIKTTKFDEVKIKISELFN